MIASTATSMLIWARQAQKDWAEQSVRRRLRVVRRLRHLIAAEAVALASTLPNTANRQRVDTLVAEVLPLADACRWLERRAEKLLRPKRLRGHRPLWMQGVVAEVQRQPLGVVLVIAPSNYPLLLPGVQVAQALVAGNAVLLKPGVGGAAAGAMLQRLLIAAGLDKHLVQILPEEAAAAADAIAQGIDKVVLTGSAETGSRVLADLAPQLTPATMELSGCDAVFVRSDADLDLVAPALAFGLRLNGGATCIAPRRVFVHEKLAPTLAMRLAGQVREAGPYWVAPQALQATRRMVSDACAHGARLLSGEFVAGEWMRPVVLVDVTPDMAIMQTEVFAPLLAMMPVADDDEALRAAAHCPYALGAVVFGREATARVLAAKVRAGMVVINDVIVPTADPRLPFGGLGRSGFGVTRGAEGLLDMTAVKALTVRRGRQRRHYAPLESGHETLFRAYLAAIHGATWRQRMRALWTGVQAAIQLIQARAKT